MQQALSQSRYPHEFELELFRFGPPYLVHVNRAGPDCYYRVGESYKFGQTVYRIVRIATPEEFHAQRGEWPDPPDGAIVEVVTD